MVSISEDLNVLFNKYATCTKCRDTIPTIHDLAEQDFKYYWKPHLRGSPPLTFVFLGFEPTKPTNPEGDSFPQEGGSSEPLQYAIREFLLRGRLEAGFLITNMAKCSLTVNELCQETRTLRFEACSSFLAEELRLARGGADGAYFISIGIAPKHFIETHREFSHKLVGGKTIHCITHYSQRNNWRFRRFAEVHHDEFGRFRDRIQPCYEDFLRRELPGHLAWYEGANGKHAQNDLQRLFTWQSEMQPIQDSLSQ